MKSILTVTTPAAARALCTLAAVKAELSITGTTLDAQLNLRIADASAAIEGYCGRQFCRQGLTEVLRGVCVEELRLAQRPVASITSLTADGALLVSGTDYEADTEAGVLYRLSSDAHVWWSAAKITVVYAAGYLLPDQASADLPADVARACVLTVCAAQLSQGRDLSIRSESAQDVGQVSYLDPREGMEALPPQVAGLLARHRVFVV